MSRASLVTHVNRTNAVQMEIDAENNRVNLTGNSPDLGKVEETVENLGIEGKSLTISFNPDYMSAALRASVTDIVVINFTEALRPFTVVPNDNEIDFIQLITPIRTF